MKNVKKIFLNLSKKDKILYSIITLFLIIFIILAIPTFARYKNRVAVEDVTVWDGSIASNYRSGDGSEDNPYLISNGAELAYFYTKLLETNYENTYFALNNNIILNDGIFSYDEDVEISYKHNDDTYYIKNYTNKYYDTVSKTGTEAGSINTFTSLNGFKGHFNGNYYTIFGLYITDDVNEEVALFTNLEGRVKNIYLSNTMIYGGSITAGVASSAKSTTISNTLFNGFVVGKNTELTKDISFDINDVKLLTLNEQKQENIFLNNTYPFIGSDILSSKLKGELSVSGGNLETLDIIINGISIEDESFEIDLGTTTLTEVLLSVTNPSSDNIELTISNLKYKVLYKQGISAGIVGLSNNLTLENVINKADIYSHSISGGLVGSAVGNLEITNSYNEGVVTSSNISGGIVGTLEKNNASITINKTYNNALINGNTNGGIIGIVSNNSIININNVIDASNNEYAINNIISGTVNIDNSSYIAGLSTTKTGLTNGQFNIVPIEDLYNKDLMKNTFSEFISFDDLKVNPGNVWVYENSSLPILYIDDIKNPIAAINLNLYSWNNYSNELSKIRLNNNITFSINVIDTLNPIKEIYYFADQSVNVLSHNELANITSWTPYDEVVTINDEGNYIVYAKIVDYDDTITFINTDIITLDFVGVKAKIVVNDKEYTTKFDDVEKIYINNNTSVTIEVTDTISIVKSIEYFLSDKILTNNELDNLEDWESFDNKIDINNTGKYIVYVKIIDDVNYNTYLNTDNIIYAGYAINDMYVGRDKSSYEDIINVTNKSLITVSATYNQEIISSLDSVSHNFKTNILLPKNTVITLKDHIKNKIYQYIISGDEDIYGYSTSCDGKTNCEQAATYNFNLFKDLEDRRKYYEEDNYVTNETVNEIFSVILDFSKTNINNPIEGISPYFETVENDTAVRSTLSSTRKTFNIYNNFNTTLELTTSTILENVILNKDSNMNINLDGKIIHALNNDAKVIDTRYENKTFGLAITLESSDGTTINRDKYKNIAFKVGENTYYPGSDNITRINLNKPLEDFNDVLTIITRLSNLDLGDENYNFKVQLYASYDGLYYDDLLSNSLMIPAVMSDENNTYAFNVIMDSQAQILTKTETTKNIAIDFSKSTSIYNTSVRLSLYKKTELSAYDQKYTLIDLQPYLNNTLNVYSDKVYYVTLASLNYEWSSNIFKGFNLDFNPSLMEKNGYKIVFSLYSQDRYIGTIEKYFIVR